MAKKGIDVHKIRHTSSREKKKDHLVFLAWRTLVPPALMIRHIIAPAALYLLVLPLYACLFIFLLKKKGTANLLLLERKEMESKALAGACEQTLRSQMGGDVGAKLPD